MTKKVCANITNMNYFDIPLGASLKDGVCRFKLSLPKALSSLELLLHKGNSTKAVELTRLPGGLLYGETKESFDYYEIISEGKRIPDKYARVIRERDEFRHTEKAFEPVVPGFSVVESENSGSCEYSFHELKDLILYKLHIRDFTMSPSSKVNYPGTFKGVTEKIAYLKKLGITGVVLMPVYDFDECAVYGHLNAWGYGCRNTYYYAPKTAYAYDKTNPYKEFAEMVAAFHKNEIDVYMEMQFGNGLPVSQIYDCVRYWRDSFGVDGFRVFDSAVSAESLLADPYLSECRFFSDNISDKAILENSENLVRINNSFRNDMRRCIKGDEGMIPALYDYYRYRSERAGVHFFADNNGFSLKDLYSYDIKHNEDNGEGNRDGSDQEFGWNCGAEGENVGKKILTLRSKMIKNAIATTVLAGGIPLIMAGDEFLATRKGNNNAYCLDNEISWINWDLQEENKTFVSFWKSMLRLRKEISSFYEMRDLSESDFSGKGFPEISAHGDTPWKLDRAPYTRMCGIYFCRAKKDDTGKFDDDFYLIYNMYWEDHVFELPVRKGLIFETVFTTGRKGKVEKGSKYLAEARSVTLLKTVGSGE